MRLDSRHVPHSAACHYEGHTCGHELLRYPPTYALYYMYFINRAINCLTMCFLLSCCCYIIQDKLC